MHAQGQRQTGTWHRRRRDAGRALSLPRAPAQRDLVAGGTARQHGAAAVIRHSKTPTSSALARDPRRRLLAAHVRDCSRPRLAYSERTPPCPVVNSLLPFSSGVCHSWPRIDAVGQELQARPSSHTRGRVGFGAGYRLAIACSIWSISIVVGGICWKRKSAIA